MLKTPQNRRKFAEIISCLSPSGAKACKSCRFRQELSNQYLLAKCGVDTAEKEPLKVLYIRKPKYCILVCWRYFHFHFEFFRNLNPGNEACDFPLLRVLDGRAACAGRFGLCHHARWQQGRYGGEGSGCPLRRI